jgi:protease-4
VLDNVHAQFIEAVKEGRGARLDSDPQLFSGLVWSGEEALDNGLVDALASTHEVARDVIGAKNIVDFTELGDPLTRLRRELGASISVLFKNTLRTLLGGNADRFLY